MFIINIDWQPSCSSSTKGCLSSVTCHLMSASQSHLMMKAATWESVPAAMSIIMIAYHVKSMQRLCCWTTTRSWYAFPVTIYWLATNAWFIISGSVFIWPIHYMKRPRAEIHTKWLESACLDHPDGWIVAGIFHPLNAAYRGNIQPGGRRNQWFWL